MKNDGDWLTLADYCKKTGERPGTVHKRVHDGDWPPGDIISNPEGDQTYVHEPRARRWHAERGSPLPATPPGA